MSLDAETLLLGQFCSGLLDYKDCVSKFSVTGTMPCTEYPTRGFLKGMEAAGLSVNPRSPA